MSDIYRMGGGKVAEPPQWLSDVAAEQLAAQRSSRRKYIKIETPQEQLAVISSDPERAVRVFWMHNPDYVP